MPLGRTERPARRRVEVDVAGAETGVLDGKPTESRLDPDRESGAALLVQHLTRRHGIGRRRDRERGGKPPTPVAPTPTPHVLPDSRFRDTCVARPSRGRSGRCDPRLTARRFPGDYRRLADVWRAA